MPHGSHAADLPPDTPGSDPSGLVDQGRERPTGASVDGGSCTLGTPVKKAPGRSETLGMYFVRGASIAVIVALMGVPGVAGFLCIDS